MDRDATIAALRALYQTRLSMSGSHLSSDLLPASPEGWTFEPSKLAEFTRSKSPEVVDLLRHLPFCRSNVAPSTSVIDYCNDDWYGARHAGNPWGGEAVVEACELPLTMQVENVGTILVLDVRTGITRIWAYKDVSSWWPCTAHAGGETDPCPLLCKGQQGVTPPQPILHVLRQWRENYLNLDWVVFGDEVRDIHDFREPEHFEDVQEVYRRCGWPDTFRFHECDEALEGVRHRIDSDSDKEESSDGDEI